MRGHIIAKEDGIVAGVDVAGAAFAMLDPSIEYTSHIEEGQRVARDHELVSLSGPARPLLTGERTALNLLGRMSGIATLTRRFVEAVAGTRAVILDTRKTAPGLRLLDKLAVKRGGGENHRIGLYDMILIKDNHIDFAGGMEEAVRRVRASQSALPIEVEARTMGDVKIALSLKVERILLDNMSVKMMTECVQLTNGQAKLEASGNVSLETVREFAETQKLLMWMRCTQA